MLARHFLIGVMALAALPNQQPRTVLRGQERLFGMNLQVWLLRGDGTALGQRSMPAHTRLILPFTETETVHFDYPLVQSQELAGVVVSLNGKLYVREINANPTS